MENFLNIKIIPKNNENKSLTKSRLLCLLFITGNLLLFNGCSSDNPEANFTASATTTAVGDTVYFTNSSLNASYFQWTFGDGSAAVTKNTAHAYVQKGNYTITLVAIGNDKSNSISKNILVTGTISIFEGVGITEVSLTDTWNTIKNKFSGQDSTMFVDTSGQYYQHSVYYSQKGIVVNFFNFLPTDIDSSEYPDEIAVLYPYAGYTAKGISLGQDISLIKTAYGTPSTQTINGYICHYYDNLGIQFWTTTSSTLIVEIDIFLPITNNSNSLQSRKPRIRPLKNNLKGKAIRPTLGHIKKSWY